MGLERLGWVAWLVGRCGHRRQQLCQSGPSSEMWLVNIYKYSHESWNAVFWLVNTLVAASGFSARNQWSLSCLWLVDISHVMSILSSDWSIPWLSLSSLLGSRLILGLGQPVLLMCQGLKLVCGRGRYWGLVELGDLGDGVWSYLVLVGQYLVLIG